MLGAAPVRVAVRTTSMGFMFHHSPVPIRLFGQQITHVVVTRKNTYTTVCGSNNYNNAIQVSNLWNFAAPIFIKDLYLVSLIIYILNIFAIMILIDKS